MTRGRTGKAPEAGAGIVQNGIDYASFFPEENLLDALLSSGDEESDHDDQDNVTPRTGQHVGGDAPASPGMSVAGKTKDRKHLMKMQAAKRSASHLSHDSSQPVAQRTRATRVANRLPAPDIDLDDVLFDVDNEELEEIENFGKVFDDDEEYQKFLVSLQHFEEQDRMRAGAAGGPVAVGDACGVVGAEGDVEDDDDGDFIDELQDMIADEVDQVLGGQRGLFQADRYLTSDMPIEKISFIFRKRGRGSLAKRKPLSKAPKQLRRSARVENQKRRYAGRLILKHNAGAHEPGRIKDAAALAALMDLSELESEMLALKEKNRTQLPTKPLSADMIEATARSVVWKPPLPSTIRKAHENLKMEAAANNTRDPELRRRFQLSMFGTKQRNMLVEQITRHVQMCFQSLCLAAIQKMDGEVIELLKRTLLSSMEGLFPALQTLGVEDMRAWEEGIHGLIQLVESNEVDEVDWRCISSTAKKKELRPCEIAEYLWSHLPYRLLRKTAKIRVCFDTVWEPKRIELLNRFTKQQLFTPAEDNLLAWGIRKHVYDWAKIREEFLPHRNESQLFWRKKNLVNADARQGNVVADAVKPIVMPLTNAEVQLLKEATSYYGKTNRGHYLGWDIICRDHLPYRTPKVLSMLWSEWRKAHPGWENR